MYKLNNDTYNLELYFNGIPFSETYGLSLTNAVVYEDLCDPVPSCKIKIFAPMKWLDDHIIADGKPFKIKVFSNVMNIDEEYMFRVLNITKLDQNKNFATFEIDGILDFYDIYSHPNEFNMYGRSSDVFRKVASTFNIVNEIDNTNDEQLWCSGGKSIYDFFNYLTAYGWRDETSAMIWALDRHKILLYKDLSNLFYTKSNNIYKFIQSESPTQGCYCYNDISCEILSGKNNFQNNGYGASNTSHFDLINYSYERTESHLLRASSKYINVNNNLIKGLSFDWCVPDVGNFNKNYYLAYLQNKRILSTYSTYFTLKSDYLEKYRLGQIVNVDYSFGREKDMKFNALSGSCVISSITISFTQTSVSCHIGAMMQGLN